MAPAPDLVLKDNCTGCRATTDLYGSNCGHLTLCVKCGKSMAETSAPCSECGVPVTRLIKVSEDFSCSPKLKAIGAFIHLFFSEVPSGSDSLEIRL